MSDDPQAIRERAERLKRVLINYSNRSADEHDVLNIADEVGLTICNDLLAALERERGLEASLDGAREANRGMKETVEIFAQRVLDAEAQLATLRPIIDAARVWVDAPLANRQAIIAAIHLETAIRAAFPASAPKGEK